MNIWKFLLARPLKSDYVKGYLTQVLLIKLVRHRLENTEQLKHEAWCIYAVVDILELCTSYVTVLNLIRLRG